MSPHAAPRAVRANDEGSFAVSAVSQDHVGAGKGLGYRGDFSAPEDFAAKGNDGVDEELHEGSAFNGAEATVHVAAPAGIVQGVEAAAGAGGSAAPDGCVEGFFAGRPDGGVEAELVEGVEGITGEDNGGAGEVGGGSGEAVEEDGGVEGAEEWVVQDCEGEGRAGDAAADDDDRVLLRDSHGGGRRRRRGGG